MRLIGSFHTSTIHGASGSVRGVVDRLVDLDGAGAGAVISGATGAADGRAGDGSSSAAPGIGSARARWKRRTATHTSTEPSTWAPTRSLRARR